MNRALALERIRVVLSRPSHPGNIGAAARAMKTMGLSRLWLVAPQRFPDPEADARASGAGDLLASATARRDERTVDVTSLDEAREAAQTGFARIPWPKLGEAGEAELAKDAVTVRCLQTLLPQPCSRVRSRRLRDHGHAPRGR